MCCTPALLYNTLQYAFMVCIRICDHNSPKQLRSLPIHIKQNVRFVSRLSIRITFASLLLSFSSKFPLATRKACQICLLPSWFQEFPFPLSFGPKAYPATSLWSATFLAITINPWRYIETSDGGWVNHTSWRTWDVEELIRVVRQLVVWMKNPSETYAKKSNQVNFPK